VLSLLVRSVMLLIVNTAAREVCRPVAYMVHRNILMMLIVSALAGPRLGF
jgi:hypothetical protein